MAEQEDATHGFFWSSSTAVQRGRGRALSELIFSAVLKLCFIFAFDVLPLISFGSI